MSEPPRFKVGDVIKAKPEGDCASVTGDKVEAGKLYTVVRLDIGGWPILHTDRHGGGGWRPTGFELVGRAPEPVDPSPSLHPGDRVKHETLGDGPVDQVDNERGIAVVAFPDRLAAVALNLLTKIEDEKSKTLLDKLYDLNTSQYKPSVASQWQIIMKHINSLPLQAAVRRHFAGLKDPYGFDLGDIELDANADAVVRELRSLLLDSEQ